MTQRWSLVCSECETPRDAAGLPSVCEACGHPWLVRYAAVPAPDTKHAIHNRAWTMWRYREWLPIADGEEPVTLGEGMTPLLRAPRLERSLGMTTIWVKDEGQNPCGSFKSRGLSAAVTRAVRAGAKSLTVPTAGNAGVALAAYGQRSGVPARVFAPTTTPHTILSQIRSFGADLQLLDGHIGDCGKAARQYATEQGATDVSTLREPYRIEGKKTMGLELAEQLGWHFPQCIIYPAGGGTGLIGMWKIFKDLQAAGWVADDLPRLFAVQSTGCAPVVRAFERGSQVTEPWSDPRTVASGLRVPAPLGGKLMLTALRETGGRAIAVSDDELTTAQRELAMSEGIDACPEGGATLAALRSLRGQGEIGAEASVLLFNTGAGWLYR